MVLSLQRHALKHSSYKHLEQTIFAWARLSWNIILEELRFGAFTYVQK